MKITEAQLKNSVSEYLTTMQAMGKLFHLRLNSGEAYLPSGNGKFYKIQLCPKGTSDFLIIKAGKAIFCELKSEKGRQSEDQLDFQQLVYYHKAAYHVIRSLEELQEIVDRG